MPGFFSFQEKEWNDSYNTIREHFEILGNILYSMFTILMFNDKT